MGEVTVGECAEELVNLSFTIDLLCDLTNRRAREQTLQAYQDLDRLAIAMRTLPEEDLDVLREAAISVVQKYLSVLNNRLEGTNPTP